jgi:hypothetical protein
MRIFGIEAPLESAFAIVPGLGEWVDGVRRKLARLVDDLRALDMPVARLLEIPRWPLAPFRDSCAARGWMYVLDANATNRRILARRIASHGLPTGYLASHDVPTERFDGIASDDAAAIVDAALEAYDCQHRWLRPDAPLATALGRTS